MTLYSHSSVCSLEALLYRFGKLLEFLRNTSKSHKLRNLDKYLLLETTNKLIYVAIVIIMIYQSVMLCIMTYD